MKYLIITLLFLNLSINLLSQIKTKIGSQEESIYPLSLNQPNINSDLMPLKALFENREIIGMGEATHGTKEFFELKAKTFKFLATECNFKVFTIEASAGGCSYINDYVQSGVGNIDSLMHFFDFWIWRTEEVKELVLWMKNYNQQKIESEKISFYGFDMQNIHSPIKYLNDVLKNDSTINFKEFQTIVKPVLSKTQLQIKGLLNDKKQKFHDTLANVNNGIIRWLAENKFNLKLNHTSLQYERISYCIENFSQASGTKQITYKYRDSCMANNVLKIQKIENAKMFLWAHNGHINLTYAKDNDVKFLGVPMSGIIKKTLETKYYSIGFVFNQGSFQALTEASIISKHSKIMKDLSSEVQECTVPVYRKNTFTSALSETNLDAFFIDLNSTTNPLFTTSKYTYDCGAMFYNFKFNSLEIIAKKQFDGLIYIDKTRRADPVK